MNPMLLVVMLLMLSQIVCPAAQTLEEVRQAVEDYFHDDRSGVAHADLRSWGDEAVPHLRALANRRVLGAELLPVVPGHFSLACAIARIDTPVAIDLLVDIACGETAVGREHGLTQLAMADDHLGRIKADERLKKAAAWCASQGDMQERWDVIDLLEAAEWEESVPLLEALRYDEERLVREAAGRALGDLTDQEVVPARPPLAFPAERLDETLLPLPPRRVQLWAYGLRFGRWTDGRRGLIARSSNALTLVGPTGEVLATLERKDIQDLIAFDGPWGRASVLVESHAVSMVGPDGEEVWRHETDGRIRAAAVVPPEAHRAPLVALAVTKPGTLTLLDGAGERVFERAWYGLKRIATQEVVAGYVFFDGMAPTLVRGAGEVVVAHVPGRPPLVPLTVRTSAVMIPDEAGGPRLLLGGWDFAGDPCVVAVTAGFKILWTASLPRDLDHMDVLESGHEHLVVGVTDDGWVHVFDGEGVLRRSVALPGENLHPTAIAAGQWEDGSHGVAVATGYSALYLFSWEP